MKTSLCLLNDRIIAVCGREQKSGVFVTAYRSLELSEGSIINGVATDFSEVEASLKKLKDDAYMKLKNVTLILDSSLIFMRQAVIPITGKRKTSLIISNEFSDIETGEKNLLKDFSILNKNMREKNASVLCYAAEKELIGSYIGLFKKAEISLSKIDISTSCIIKYAKRIQALRGKTYVVSVIGENAAVLYLFVKNQYFYSTRARLLSEPFSDDFYQEISAKLSSMLQFFKSQHSGFDISDVYLCGLDDSQAAKCAFYINDLGIAVSSSAIFDGIISRRKNLNTFSGSDYLYNIGSFLKDR
ncbi:MAG: hypothetical protein WC900_01610 [Oscillospiraceae bacterium]|jgi:hypothetical protein